MSEQQFTEQLSQLDEVKKILENTRAEIESTQKDLSDTLERIKEFTRNSIIQHGGMEENSIELVPYNPDLPQDSCDEISIAEELTSETTIRDSLMGLNEEETSIS